MFGSQASAALRIFNRRIIGASLVYAALLTAAVLAERQLAPGLAARAALALLPGVALVAVFVVVGRYLVDEADEYLRGVMVRKILWATGATLVLATIWGFLDEFTVVPRLPMWHVTVCWLACLGVLDVAGRRTSGV